MIFTHVSVRLAKGENLILKEAWEKLPAGERSELILKDAVTFMRFGKIIPLQEVLMLMRQEKAANAQ